MDFRRTRFVRNATDKEKGGSLSLSHAFSCALHGFWEVLKTQRNAKIHCFGAAIALILGFVFSLSLSQWCLILVCIGMVFSTECINTALEAVVDLVSPHYADLARRAKDCAAAAVLVSALVSFVVGVIVFGSAFLRIFEFAPFPL